MRNAKAVNMSLNAVQGAEPVPARGAGQIILAMSVDRAVGLSE